MVFRDRLGPRPDHLLELRFGSRSGRVPGHPLRGSPHGTPTFGSESTGFGRRSTPAPAVRPKGPGDSYSPGPFTCHTQGRSPGGPPGTTSVTAARRKVETVHEIRWISLAGLANLRDVGGLPTLDGAMIAPGRLLRSDNLQDLPADTQARLVDDLGVTDVIDLRTYVEIAREGSGPFVGHERVRTSHFTLYADDTGQRGIPQLPDGPDDAATDPELPWVVKDRKAQAAGRPAFADPEVDHDTRWSGHYLDYLRERPDSVVGALRTISMAEGAVLVHCAAGKDRTGTIVGLALAAAGAQPEAIARDYAATAERLEAVLARLRTSPAYAAQLAGQSLAQQTPRAETMRTMLQALQRRYGGALGWLGQHGWTASDTAALHAKLRS